jgi:thioredoxin reductase
VLADGDEVRARAVVLATGMDYEVPDVPGFHEHWGGGVFHCPFCHGWEVRDRRLVVYAEDAGKSVQLASLLRGWTDDVAVVDTGEVARLRADDGAVQAVVLRDGSEVACDGVLVHAPLRLRGHLHERLGLELTVDGLVAIDGLAHTSVPGVYAAGDIAVAPQQVAISLGSGHLAGVVAVRELLVGRPAQTPA